MSVECHVLAVQLGGLLLPTAWLSLRILEEGRTLWIALWEQVEIMSKHCKIIG